MHRNNKKLMHLSIIIVMIVAIIFTALIIVLKYGQDGETNMPFEVSKIIVISTVGAQDVENSNKEWELEVSQNNDIYAYIQKNEKYTKTETIKQVKIDKINVNKQPNIGMMKFYKPSKSKVSIFENTKDYESTQINFEGDKKTNIQNSKISNQGGIIAFRCANEDLGIYKAIKGKEVVHSELLKKIKINNEDLKTTISFNLTIVLNSGKAFEGTFDVDLPIDDIVADGQTSIEITDFKDTVFKRIENK